MKLSEAIKDLQLDLDNPGSVDYEERVEAQALGIEALKAIQNAQNRLEFVSPSILSGQTLKDDTT